MKYALALMCAVLLGQPASGQEAIALAVEGWRQETGQDGIVYYRCASEICAAGSVVSFKVQPHRSALTLEAFEIHHRRLAEHNRGPGISETFALLASKSA